MKNNNSLGKRMKKYEYVSRTYLTRKIPIIIRLDGKAFHTFCKGLFKPFDAILIKSMQETAKYLCENIQGCKVAYVQSDEITLLITDFENIDTEAWFEYNIQKMISISASMATLAFNISFNKNVENYFSTNYLKNDRVENIKDQKEIYESKFNRALFDSRVFSLPKEEVCNCFIWRQQDATRNSIQMLGQANFSHKQLQKKSCSDIQDMLIKKDINWNNLRSTLKRGSCIIKKQIILNDIIRNKWIIDDDIPIFSKDRQYIEKFLSKEDK